MQVVLMHDRLDLTPDILDALKNHKRIKPERVIIDHVEEHTAPLVLDRGF